MTVRGSDAGTGERDTVERGDIMSNFVSVIFCRNCSSRFVDISEWTEDGKPILWCRSCNTRETVSHFTLGRAKVSNTDLQNARDSMAKKGQYEK